LSQTIGVLG